LSFLKMVDPPTTDESSIKMTESDISSSNLLSSLTPSEATLQTTNHVYIRDDKYAWIPARVEKTSDDGTTADVVIPEYKDERSIQSDGGRRAKRFRKETINLSDYPNKALPLQNVDEKGNLKEVGDMVDLSFLHEVRREDAAFILLWGHYQNRVDFVFASCTFLTFSYLAHLRQPLCTI
jgi:hypothetical protein